MALMKLAVIPEFFARLKKAIPEPETELEYDNVYQLLVAVVLSAQATDAGVNRATTPLFEKIKTPAQMVALGETRLLRRVPEQYRLHAHHWLILHGRYTCKARKPGCPRCVVNDLCLFKGKSIDD